MDLLAVPIDHMHIQEDSHIEDQQRLDVRLRSKVDISCWHVAVPTDVTVQAWLDTHSHAPARFLIHVFHAASDDPAAVVVKPATCCQGSHGSMNCNSADLLESSLAGILVDMHLQDIDDLLALPPSGREIWIVGLRLGPCPWAAYLVDQCPLRDMRAARPSEMIDRHSFSEAHQHDHYADCWSFPLVSQVARHRSR